MARPISKILSALEKNVQAGFNAPKIIKIRGEDAKW